MPNKEGYTAAQWAANVRFASVGLNIKSLNSFTGDYWVFKGGCHGFTAEFGGEHVIRSLSRRYRVLDGTEVGWRRMG